jgi:hypothetical protein
MILIEKHLFCKAVQVGSNLKTTIDARAVSFIYDLSVVRLATSRAFDVLPNSHTIY